MSFSFKVQMIGLCHFVENGDASRICQVCVLLPDSPANVFSPRSHEPRLVYQSNFLQSPPSPPAEDVTVESLRRQRVAFRFTPAAGSALAAPSLHGKLTRIIKVEELVATPGPYVELVNIPAGSAIGAQVLLDQGSLEEEMEAGRWKLVGPAGTEAERSLPSFVSLTIGPVDQAEVVITPFDSGSSKVHTFVSSTGEDVNIVITADCDLRSTTDPPATAIQVDTPDEDFGAHYLFFQQLAADAANRPVPLQLAVPPAEAALFDAALMSARGLRSKGRFVIKRRMSVGHAPMTSGGGVEVEPQTAALVVQGPATPGGGGGGSDCQNGTSALQPNFDLDPFLPAAGGP